MLRALQLVQMRAGRGGAGLTGGVAIDVVVVQVSRWERGDGDGIDVGVQSSMMRVGGRARGGGSEDAAGDEWAGEKGGGD